MSLKLGPSESIINVRSIHRSAVCAYFMFLNMSSAPSEYASSLNPNDLSSGSAGGGGPCFFCVCVCGCVCGCSWGGGAAFAGACPLVWREWFSLASGSDPIKVLFLLPNQLLLFLRVRLGWLCTVAGDPGRSDWRLSEDERVRRPRNLRTEEGRLLEGLAGDRVLALPSLVVV